MRHVRWAAAATALAAGVLLAGCGGADDGDQASLDPTSAEAQTLAEPELGAATPTPSVTLPAGVELTPPGTQLALGQSATVFWAPAEDLHAALDVTVSEVHAATADELKGYDLSGDEYAKNASFFFVSVAVTNQGDGDIGGLDVPITGLDAAGVQLPPVTFDSPFKSCPSKPLPSSFGAGATYDGCVVFAVADQGGLAGVVFHPVESIEAIRWPGAPAAYIAPAS